MMVEENEETDLDVFDQDKVDQTSPEEKEWIRLPHAELLSVEDADELLRWRAANVVAVVGERGAGKTTLVTEIYERFLRGPFAGLHFAGSRTIAGFERRCYLARLIVGASAPDTERTSGQAALGFFHLGLATELEHRTDLLIAERAGESYRTVRDNPSLARGFLELTKARTVAFVLDGSRMADNRLREEAISSARNLIRGSAESGAIPARAEIQLVTTKVDLLQTDGTSHALDALAEFERRLTAAYEGRFARVSCWRTAARDPTGRTGAAYGMEPLLRSWLAPPVTPRTTIPIPALRDEFDRFLVRVTS